MPSLVIETKAGNVLDNFVLTQLIDECRTKTELCTAVSIYGLLNGRWGRRIFIFNGKSETNKNKMCYLCGLYWFNWWIYQSRPVVVSSA